jgi:uncharacterized membrane protein YdjX (TVP38/TMEM64 family)
MRVSITSSCDCSASNYLLGMTPLELPAFMTGTVAGMTVWGIVYASLGGASRSLLKSGVDLEELIGGEIAITKYMMHSYQIPGHA